MGKSRQVHLPAGGMTARRQRDGTRARATPASNNCHVARAEKATRLNGKNALSVDI